MSEITTTIIKLISTLVSRRVAIRCIFVAVFIVISWKYFSVSIKEAGVPAEQMNNAIFLLSLGLGYLVGELLSWLCELIWNFFEKKRFSKRHKEKQIEKNERMIRRYRKVFPCYDVIQRTTLRGLTLKDTVLDFSIHSFGDLFKPLRESGYIEVLHRISNEDYLVRINPIIKEITKDIWEKEIDRHVCCNKTVRVDNGL